MSLHTALVKIEEQKISSEKAKRFIYSDKNGAESIFVGRVRNENDGKKVTGITYDAHEQAVIKSFQSICNDAKNKFDNNRANKSMMAWGVEARVPFLDREFLEYSMNLDP